MLTEIEHVFQEHGLEVSSLKEQSDSCACDIYFLNINDDWSVEAAYLVGDDVWMVFLFYDKDPTLVYWPIVQFPTDVNYQGPFSILETGGEKEAGFYRQRTTFDTMVDFLKLLKNAT